MSKGNLTKNAFSLEDARKVIRMAQEKLVEPSDLQPQDQIRSAMGYTGAPKLKNLPEAIKNRSMVNPLLEALGLEGAVDPIKALKDLGLGNLLEGTRQGDITEPQAFGPDVDNLLGRLPIPEEVKAGLRLQLPSIIAQNPELEKYNPFKTKITQPDTEKWLAAVRDIAGTGAPIPKNLFESAPLPELDPEGKEMIRSLLLGHELDETVTHPWKAPGYFSSHVSPDVISKEYNRLMTMPPEIRDALAKRVRFIRDFEQTEFAKALPGFDYEKPYTPGKQESRDLPKHQAKYEALASKLESSGDPRDAAKAAKIRQIMKGRTLVTERSQKARDPELKAKKEILRRIKTGKYTDEFGGDRDRELALRDRVKERMDAMSAQRAALPNRPTRRQTSQPRAVTPENKGRLSRRTRKHVVDTLAKRQRQEYQPLTFLPEAMTSKLKQADSLAKSIGIEPSKVGKSLAGMLGSYLKSKKFPGT